MFVQRHSDAEPVVSRDRSLGDTSGGDDCTLIGCSSSEFAVRLLLDEDLLPGSYRFVFRHDRETTICEGRLPGARCAGLVDTSCDSEFVRFGSFTCGESTTNQVVGRIRFGNLPDVVDVQVLRDGMHVMQAHYDVHYPDEWWPNGKDCGLRCGHATVDLAIATCDPKRS